MLYHIDTGIPFNINLPAELNLYFSNHALHAAENDRYGKIKLSSIISTKGAKVVEVETNDQNQPIKMVVRLPYDHKRDVVYVINLVRPINGSLVVRTVWFNEKTDTHKTLNRSNYARAI